MKDEEELIEEIDNEMILTNAEIVWLTDAIEELAEAIEDLEEQLSG